MTKIQKFILIFLFSNILILFFINIFKEEYRGESPNSARKYWNLGQAYQEEGRFNEAIEQYLIALEIKPHLPGALSNISAIYIDTGDANFIRSAENLLEEAIDYYPKFPGSYANLAIIYMRRGELDQALELINKSLELSSNSFVIWINKGDILQNMSRGCEARMAYEISRNLRPDLNITEQRGLRGKMICPLAYDKRD